METAQHAPLALRVTRYFQEMAEESRQFWDTGRIRLALTIIAGILVLEVLIAAALYAGADGQFGRAPLVVHQVASFFGLNAAWAKAIFRATETIEIPQYQSFDRNLRDPFALTSNVLRDVAGIIVTWLLPIFAAIAFTSSTGPSTNAGRGKKLLLWFLTTVGPLGLIALSLTAVSAVVHTVFAYLASPPPDPTLYPAQRFVLAPWGSAGYDLLFTSRWVLTPFLLIPTVAVAFRRDRQQCLAACLGTSLFLIPLVGIAAATLYPGGPEAIPPLLAMNGDPLIKLALFALALPFALKALRSNSDPLGSESA